MADDGTAALAPIEHATDEGFDLEAAHEALALTPGQRATLEDKGRRLAAREAKQGRVVAFARLRPDDRELLERAVGYWQKAFDKAPRNVDPLVEKVWRGGKRRAAENKTRKRFAAVAIDPARVTGLDEGHSALEEARTIFPKSVTSAWDSPRLLVGGGNNAKLGAKLEKGDWPGLPVFHLTLEERATCPGPDRQTGEGGCPLWATCYGNAMHLARRHDARSDNFLDFLRAELWLMARAFPKGYAVRLHTLGDFYSVEYVAFWRELVEALPMLHVWGYTQRAPGDPIRAALEELTATHWSRFAIRWSTTPGPQGTIVVDDLADAGDAIPCPAQHTAAEAEVKSDSCSTCGLCWSSAARGKTVAFLRHGMTRGASPD